MMQQIEQAIDKRLNEADRPDFINQFFADLEVKRQQALVDANASTPRTTKLSALQRQILAIALRWHGKAHSDVYSSDIKAEVFGWRAMNHYWNGWIDEGWAVPGTARYAEDHHMAGESMSGQIFDRSSIGTKEYNSVSVSVSRALNRLTERYLLYQSGAGWSLTEHRAKVVKTATAPSES